MSSSPPPPQEKAAAPSPKPQQSKKKSIPAPATPSAPSALEDDGPKPTANEGGTGGDEAEGDEEEAAGEDKGVDYRLLAKMGK